MDWFERLTGFRELDPEASHARAPARRGRAARLARERQSPRDRPTGAASLRELRRGVADAGSAPRGSTVRNGVGDVRALHRAPEFEGALFRVASQFNLLEMVSPGVSPEDGVTRYMHDPTQGPACAIAAGAATVYRNYFVPVGEACGQTAARQLDALAPLGAALAGASGDRCPRSGACATATRCARRTAWRPSRRCCARPARPSATRFGPSCASACTTTSR